MPTFVKASGWTYTDENGDKWTDLISGIQNVPLGHNSSAVWHAISRVGASGLVNCYNVPSYERTRLAVSLTHNFPSLNWSITSSGTEAIERALQMHHARTGVWHGRVLYVPGAFHGKSYALARARYNWGSSLMVPFTKAAMQTPFDAIIYEPVQGLSGKRIDGRALRRICDATGAALIADEMISGFGRCGEWFLSTRDEPDYITCGKGVASGVAIAFVASKRKIGDIPTGWTTTAAGNALSCAIAHDTLAALTPKHLDAANTLGQAAKEVFPDARVAGALIHIPVQDELKARLALERRRLVALYSDNTIRLAPCLTMPVQVFKNILLQIEKEIRH